MPDAELVKRRAPVASQAWVGSIGWLGLLRADRLLQGFAWMLQGTSTVERLGRNAGARRLRLRAVVGRALMTRAGSQETLRCFGGDDCARRAGTDVALAYFHGSRRSPLTMMSRSSAKKKVRAGERTKNRPARPLFSSDAYPLERPSAPTRAAVRSNMPKRVSPARSPAAVRVLGVDAGAATAAVLISCDVPP